MGVRTSVAKGLGRLTHWGLRTIVRRPASQLPGRVALALDHQILSELANRPEQGSIVVCGTNGKTTTTNVIASAVEASGMHVLCNRYGANMEAGVTAAFLESGRSDWAIIEADELSTKQILPALQPRYLVLLNLFRDQLDRAGEIDRIQDTIAKALLSSPHTTLVVCGDDPLSMAVAHRVHSEGTSVIAFGIAEDLGLESDRVPEGRFCQLCGAELTYDYRSYAQLGAFRCPKGDFCRPVLDYAARNVKVEQEGVSFEVKGRNINNPISIDADFGGVYMVYNLLAAFVAARLAGVSEETFSTALKGYDPHNGRLQHFVVDGRDVVLNLAKNPTGFNQNISLLQKDKRKKIVVFVVNDQGNDGRDISWIWDVDFERLSDAAAAGELMVMVGGARAAELRVRLKYAEVCKSAPMVQTMQETLGRLSGQSRDIPLYVLCNYSALWPAKAELEKLGDVV